MRGFIVRRWFRQDPNNALHIFLSIDCGQYNYKLAIACGLVTIPKSRRIFNRRLLKTISVDIKERISPMGYLFVVEGLIDLSITAPIVVISKKR